MKIKGDTKFMAYARELQNDWRVKNKFPIGKYKNKNEEYIELGNYIEENYAYDKGANFLSENIKTVVEESLKNKEYKAKIEEKRLYTNLLSSQPLAFNLFAELSINLELATTFFKKMFPNKIQKITKIIFEHSDGRGNIEYTGDHSAFDVFIEFIPINGKSGFIAIEVKYSESLKDEPATHKQRYDDLTIASKLFNNEKLELLKFKPLQQIWRDHLLSISHLKHVNNKYDIGFFVYLYPSKNIECDEGVKAYKKCLISEDAETTGFFSIYMEDFVNILSEFDNSEWLNKFRIRYFGQ